MLAPLLRRLVPATLAALTLTPALAAAAPPIGSLTEVPAPTAYTQNSAVVAGARREPLVHALSGG